jgi:selenocysteine lyase/cysteine desulfurase
LNTIVDVVDRAMTPANPAVMIGHVVLIGKINQMYAVADRVHARGATLLVDGVLGFGHEPTNVTAIDSDSYAAGFHKSGASAGDCGPYVRPDLVERPTVWRYREEPD